MVLKRCDRGHFYNGDKYQECPRCASKGVRGANTPKKGEPSGIKEPVTAAVAEPVTAATSSVTDSVTAAASSGMADSVTAAVPFAVTGSMEEPVTMPVRASAAEPVTMPVRPAMDAQPGSAAPGNLQAAVNKAIAPPYGKDDDEKTVSIYQSRTGVDPVAGWLVCIAGDDFGRSFTIKSGRNFIGRSQSMDIVLRGDSSISREKHAVILYEPKRREFIAQAGESRELFYLNDEVVLNPARLKEHDVLTIGNTSLMFFPCCSENFSWDNFR